MIKIILAFIAIAFVMMFFYRFFKKTMKTAFVIGFFFGLILLIFGFFVIQDAMDFKENFATGKNLFILSNEEDYLVGLALSFSSDDDPVGSFDVAEIEDTLLENFIPEGFYKVFVLTKESLETADINDIDLFGVAILSKEEVIQALYGDDPTGVVANSSERTRETITEFLGSSTRIKENIFTFVLIDVFSEPLNLIGGVKNGNIIIYPETLMFKTIKFIPLSLFEHARKVRGE